MSIQSRRLNQFFLSSKDTKIQELFLNRTVIYELILQGFVFFTKKNESTKITINTWFNGCLGSHNDEERSEMRYVMRIAESSESSKFWTHLALPFGEYVCWSVCSSHHFLIIHSCMYWKVGVGRDVVKCIVSLRCNIDLQEDMYLSFC